MLMGKRPRPHMSRTTSMAGFELDVDPMDVVDAFQPSDHQQTRGGSDWLAMGHVAPGGMMPPRNTNHRRNAGDSTAAEIAPFLKNCGLCNRRLRSGKDIYMYRGEIAFCSLECREQRIKNDERIEKRALSAIKTDTTTASSGSEASDSSETVAMA